ncbi:hypothetical protein [uncultured Marinobacter sp.]|uniref:hypothetical protein n=1 Tax=uncultured Marinobacter sp. TaxID=187379 RepID=UPI0025E3D32E|nr:hypothetical protein [uncultured Marinobacter sp.]
MNRIGSVIALSFVMTLGGCSVIGGGSGTNYAHYQDGACDIVVSNQGSFLSGHHIEGMTGRREIRIEHMERMASYLMAEGYDIRTENRETQFTGVFLSNGKQYHMAVSVDQNTSGQNRLKLSFSTPPLIGLLTSHVRDEFCKIEATAQFAATTR